MLRGKEPGPGESGPWGGQGGDGALAGCGGKAVTVPGSCLIIPFSIWALRVLGGDSECFLFLEGWVGSLGRQVCAMGELAFPEPSPSRPFCAMSAGCTQHQGHIQQGVLSLCLLGGSSSSLSSPSLRTVASGRAGASPVCLPLHQASEGPSRHLYST